jgi:toxin ParE1/3/4
MTGRYTLSPRAKADLDNIWDRTVERGGTDQAEFYIRQLWQHIMAAAPQPTLGRACPEVRAGYYKYRSGSHFLFYRLIDGGIDVVRILHERMDFGRHL